ncbi:MAG: MGMT family protein [Candidatus Daviesbacteria bacterium]|nr:MGMT family protein [Candidatus Daviesbacteria bacterium]
MGNFKTSVIKIVQKIPYGRVSTYGTVALLAGMPRNARLVGGVLQRSEDNLPWQRVINRHGFLSIKGSLYSKDFQKKLLEAEGVEVSTDFMVDLKKYGWFG